nr:helix-turn-helix domain-containing protein [uncultured Sphaerochaeta sp.]
MSMICRRLYKVRHGKITMNDGRSYQVPCLQDSVLVVESYSELLLLCEMNGKALEESEGAELSPCSCVNGCLIRKDKIGQSSCPLADRRYVMADDDLAVTPPHDNDLEFGKIVQEERKRLGLSMYRLAQLSGVCSTTIRNIEAGIRSTERTKAFVRDALNDCAQGRFACNG